MKRATGKAARDRGEAFETDLLTAYRPDHVYLQRTSPPWRYVRKGRTLAVVVVEEGVPDFHGAIDGRAVVLDAKATGDARWELRNIDADLATHLDTAHARGVVAGILLRWDASGAVYWLPWQALGPLWHGWRRGIARHGEASITPRDAAQLGREVRGMRWWEAVQVSC